MTSNEVNNLIASVAEAQSQEQERAKEWMNEFIHRKNLRQFLLGQVNALANAGYVPTTEDIATLVAVWDDINKYAPGEQYETMEKYEEATKILNARVNIGGSQVPPGVH